MSGGIAAILAGFIGFLICEKFGLELLDSGDFYYAFMYAVITCFSIRPILRILSKDNTTWSFVSPKYLISFYKNLVLMLLNSLKSLSNGNSKRFLRSVSNLVTLLKTTFSATSTK